MRYLDRVDAGRRLAQALSASGEDPPPDGVILGVPRGGVIVAYEVATRLGLEFAVAPARKLGAPQNPELAIGAIGEHGDPIIDQRLVKVLGVTGEYIRREVERQRRELARRIERYRGEAAAPQITGRWVGVVDDGVATGSTLLAVLESLRAERPARLVCAIPVGPRDAIARLGELADAVICPLQPVHFRAVGEWYDDFRQTTDEEVEELLRSASG